MGIATTQADPSRPPLVQFRCGSCGRTNKARRELLGRKVRCSCGQIVEIRDKDSTGPLPPASPESPTPGLPAAAAGGPDSTPTPVVPAAAPHSPASADKCYYCGRDADPAATDSVVLVSKTKAATEAAAQEYRLKASGATVARNVWTSSKMAGYGQTITVPRCRSCKSLHGKPALWGVLVFLVALPAMFLLSSAGYWPSYTRIARGMADTKLDVGSEDLAKGMKTLGMLKPSHMEAKGSEIRISPLYMLLIAAMIYLLPAMAAGALVFGCMIPVQCGRMRRRGLQWRSARRDHPRVKEQVALGWQ